MGIGPGVLAFYALMRRDGLFDKVNRIFELGAQVIYCQDNEQAVLNLFDAFGVAPPGPQEVKKLARGASARALFERLGMEYWSLDASGEYGALGWDLNFDECPPEHRGQYHLVTNHGTTEHVLNQLNCFKIAHDLAARGGLMIHTVPFLSYVDHGYFNYQPSFFVDLAKANGYEMLGMWIRVDPKFSHFIPWEHGLERHLRLGAGDSDLLVLFRKTSDEEFGVPFQGFWVDRVPDTVLRRYRYVVDGQVIRGRRGLTLPLEDAIEQIPGRRLLLEAWRRFLRRSRRMLRGLAG